jgi:hypothetical protein
MLVPVVSVDDVRAVASALPRAYEVLVRDRVKFRVGRIVFLAFSGDEALMGFAFPKEERVALVGSEPDKFLMPAPSDMRYNWARCRLGALSKAEMLELVVDAWQMAVPKKVAAEYMASTRPTRSMAKGGPELQPPGKVEDSVELQLQHLLQKTTRSRGQRN